MTKPVTSLQERLRITAEQPDSAVRELLAVREIAHAFLTADRPEQVYQFALDRVSPLVGATFACVYLIEDDAELMRLAAVHNWPQRWAHVLSEMRVRLGKGPSGEAAAERRTIEVLDLFANPAHEDWREAATELGFRSFVALPLQTSDAVLGTVTFYFASAHAVNPETRQLMRTVADQMAATAEKARMIHDLQRANAALRDSHAALERQYADLLEARRTKDEFLANISHELRTPLTAVIGYISLMQEGFAGPMTGEQQQTLEQVKESSEQLLGLIGDLLELTALKRGTVAAAVADLDPRAPLRDALATAKARRPEVSLEVTEPEEVPVMRGDRATLTRALRALIDNAFKFTHHGSVKASVRVAGDRVLYTISDTGIGIPAEAHRLVFEEFRQVDGGLTREYGGPGLGLALARRLARLLQGDIALTSAPGVGSTFTLNVPLRFEAPQPS
ncbi:MAG TPA: GAF domain-containing sensor histidine kinase [Gemmatimonadaceae bacterium]|nr:GAF domain-containing sensor histidine kinase [Gemmatimonadaceae bacterium]